jgi:hypothetical protein
LNSIRTYFNKDDAVSVLQISHNPENLLGSQQGRVVYLPFNTEKEMIVDTTAEKLSSQTPAKRSQK